MDINKELLEACKAHFEIESLQEQASEARNILRDSHRGRTVESVILAKRQLDAAVLGIRERRKKIADAIRNAEGQK